MTTKEELAKMLNGCEYRNEVSRAIETLAKENNLVIVHGYSDDLIEFRGAVDEEFGSEAIFTDDGRELSRCDDNCIYSQEAHKKANKIKGHFGRGGWTYTTTIPHALFDVMEDGELYGKGLVFNLKQLK